jgi:hypothetical protein
MVKHVAKLYDVFWILNGEIWTMAYKWQRDVMGLSEVESLQSSQRADHPMERYFLTWEYVCGTGLRTSQFLASVTRTPDGRYVATTDLSDSAAVPLGGLFDRIQEARKHCEEADKICKICRRLDWEYRW